MSLHDASSASPRPASLMAKVLGSLAFAAIVLLGVLVLGRLASSDVMAMTLTTVFFAVLAGALFLRLRGRRELLVPLGATFLVVAGGAGVVLGAPLIFDDVVDEDVVRIAEPSDAATAAPEEDGASPDGSPAVSESPVDGPTEVASGQFAARSHPGSGTATLIDLGDDGTVLTLTEFETDNGPDLLVYLVPPDAPIDSVDGGVNLGRLKGNVGDQQYAVPDVGAGEQWRVVVWCRAFTVSFTEATLG